MKLDYLYKTTRPAVSVYDSLFGGMFENQSLFLILKVLFPLVIVLTLTSLFLEKKKGCERFSLIRKGGMWLGFVIGVILLNDPWDEVFTNLRHSLNFVHSGHYSFQIFQNVEATVDFLVYFLLGVLGKLGLPLVESCLLQSLLGGILCLVAVHRILQKTVAEKWWADLGVVLVSLYPALGYNSASGFGTTFFAADVLWGFYLLFLTPKRTLGIFLLSLLPVIRFEGTGLLLILLAFEAFFRWKEKRSSSLFFPVRRFALNAGIAIWPALILAWYRFYTFGDWVPAPVHYKASLDWEYLKMGLGNLNSDLFFGFLWFALPVTILGFWIGRGGFLAKRKTHNEVLALFGFALCCFVFTLAYYLSGGDWFPYWIRYLFPFALTFLTLMFSVLSYAFNSLALKTRPVAGVTLVVAFLTYSLTTPARATWVHEVAQLRVFPRGDARISDLSKVGHHLGMTTRPSDEIASSELSTLMYFADRDALDLFGVSNPEIYSRPLLIPAHCMMRRFRPFDLIDRHRPAIVWPHSTYSTNFYTKAPLKEVLLQFKLNEHSVSEFNYDYFGGVPHVQRLGYSFVGVQYADFFLAYLVSPEALGAHLKKMESLGFEKTALNDPEVVAAENAAEREYQNHLVKEKVSYTKQTHLP